MVSEAAPQAKNPGVPARALRLRWALPRASSLAFPLLCATLLIALHWGRGLNRDEGVILNGAWNLLNGRSLYTDFFELVAPGTFYLVFALWKAFGAEEWIARAVGITAIAAAGAGIHCTSRLIASYHQITLPRWAIVPAPLVFFLTSGYWPTINHNTFNLAFAVWGSFWVLRALLSRSPWHACVAGLLTGVATLFLQHRGVALGGCAVLTFIWLAFRDKDLAWVRTCIYFAAGMLTPLTVVFLAWPASLLFENLILFPATRYVDVNRVDHSFFTLASLSVLSAVWLLSACLRGAAWFLVVLQVALMLTALQRPDYAHVTLALFPILSLLPLIWAGPHPGSSWTVQFFRYWIAAGMILQLVPLGIHLALTYQQRSAAPSSAFRAIEFVREHCTSSPYLYAKPFDPGLYFATQKLNATRYSVLLTRFNTEAQFDEARTDIEKHRPHCVVMNRAIARKFNYDENNAVERYIASHYRLAYEGGAYQVLVARHASRPERMEAAK